MNIVADLHELVMTASLTGDWSEFDKCHNASMDAIFGVMQLRREFRVTRSFGTPEKFYISYPEIEGRFLFACTGYVQGRLL